MNSRTGMTVMLALRYWLFLQCAGLGTLVFIRCVLVCLGLQVPVLELVIFEVLLKYFKRIDKGMVFGFGFCLFFVGFVGFVVKKTIRFAGTIGRGLCKSEKCSGILGAILGVHFQWGFCGFSYFLLAVRTNRQRQQREQPAGRNAKPDWPI